MVKLKIKNFGPIKEGLSENDGFIEVSKVTVFMGRQGSGKSTIAKLLSTFLWLEKAFNRGDFVDSELTYEIFVKKYLAWQCIDSYIDDNSEIEFIGCKYHFTLRKRIFDFKELKDVSPYVRPKITYFPSERNFCSSIPRADSISNILHNLSIVIDDFQTASENTADGNISLPVDDYIYRYDKDKRKKYITQKNSNYKIQLHEAASGFQSIVPLAVVTDYFSDSKNAFVNTKKQVISVEQRKMIEELVAKYEEKCELIKVLLYEAIPSEYRYIARVLELCGIQKPKSAILSGKAKNIKDSDKLIADFDSELKGILNSCFVSIVEEPEQNLFPNSQKELVEFLVQCAKFDNNRLILTTHSPYILGALNNCLYAGNLLEKGYNAETILSKNVILQSEDIKAYFISNGKITSAFDDEIKQINHDLIDGCSRDLNSDYDKLNALEYPE